MAENRTQPVAGPCNLRVAQTGGQSAPGTCRIHGLGTGWQGSCSICQPNADLVPLAVVKPRGNNSPEQYLKMGEALRAWKLRCPQVQHIWGLDELLAGKPPKSPCDYFLIPRSPADLRDGHEPVALVMVQADADMSAIGNSLFAALQDVKAALSSLTDLDNYCYQNR
jgi:hypothetical protein